MPHATNHKNTTATEKIKCAIARNPLNIKYWSVSFFFVCQGGDWLENHIIECFIG
ncbi:hypothetical protein ACR9KK_06100 [Helicobacter pylori]